MTNQLIDVETRCKVDRENAIDIARCGSCGREWDDGKITHLTPTPAGRCPFEDLHGFSTVDDVRKRNAETGHHFFDRDALRFFSSRISDDLYGGRYFVTSERFESYRYSEPRRYTVRRANDDGTIDDVGGFQAFATLAQAKARARYLAEHGEG